MHQLINKFTTPDPEEQARLQAELATVTVDELRAAYRKSRIKFTQRIGFLHALQSPTLRKTLELQALGTRRKQAQALAAQNLQLEAA